MKARTVGNLLEGKGYELYSVQGEDTVLSALREMADRNIGALLVFDGEELVGVITERDCARKLDLMGRSARSTRVDQVMERQVATIRSSATIEESLRVMTELRMRHLPVVDDELVGLISIGDVGKAMIVSQEHLIDDLTGYITGSPR